MNWIRAARWRSALLFCAVAICPIRTTICQAQATQATDASIAPTTQPGDDLIALNLPETIELKVLADYVSRRLDVNIMYGEDVGSQKIVLKTPAKIPRESLMGLLQSAAQMKGFALVDGEGGPGLKKIVPVTNLAATARPFQPGQPATRPGEQPTAVTQVFRLQHIDTTTLDQAVKIFLTQPGGNSIPIPAQRMLVITDYASNIARIGVLVDQLDQPKPDVSVELVPVTSADGAQLAPQVSALIAARTNAQGGLTPGAGSVDVSFSPQTNQIVVVGPKERIDSAIELIHKLDVPSTIETRTYRFEHIAPERVDKMLKQLVDPKSLSRAYQAAIDPSKDGHILIAVATPEMHKRIEAIKKEIDVAPTTAESPIRFYKLANTTAADVLASLRGIVGAEDTGGTTGAAPSEPAPKKRSNPGRSNPLTGRGSAGMNSPLGANNGNSTAPGPTATGTGEYTPATQQIGGAPHTDPLNRDVDTHVASAGGFITDDARVSADPNTNTLIVVAPPSVQRTYEDLIRNLDKRRPQVLIECTLVTLDTSHDFTLGVEILGKGTVGKTELLGFTQFGLSTLANGQLNIIPGNGFNGAVISSDVANAIAQAVAHNSHSRVLSAPRILVNDNATGTLTSIAEEPFTSINTAVGTVSTTSFAGYAQAGTEITVTPHISDANYLQLEYTVSLNNFTGTGSNGIPPPRQTDAVDSTVTIPDGSTIIVGGLHRQNYSKAVTEVPLLGEIPLVKYFFSTRNDNSDNATLFVFLRPIILRDDQFVDLKYLSQRDAKSAEIPGDFPDSAPVLME